MMKFDTLNMIQTDLDRVIRQISHQIEDEDYTPVILLGKSGIGKTEAVRSLTDSLGIGYVELRLSHYQESDLIGLPYIDDGGMTAHAPARLLPPSEDTGQGILLLDEVTSSPRSMRSAVYQLLDDSRKLGQYRLPKRWLVVAAGNGPDDGGDFRGMEPAFLSRGFCWRVEPDLQVWKAWAEKHDIHPIVISYLAYKPDCLHVMDPQQPYDMIACPRNWAKLSTQLKNMERRAAEGEPFDDAELEFAVAGAVGKSCTADFCAFYLHGDEIIDAARIADGDVPAEELRDLSEEGLYITMQSYVRFLADEMKSRARVNLHPKTPEDALPYEMDELERIAANMRWIIEVGEKVRLDAAVAMISDLNTATEGALASIAMTEVFEEQCPQFSSIAMLNGVG